MLMHDDARVVRRSEGHVRDDGLGLSRAEAVAAAEAAGYTFAPLAAGMSRPHVTGRSADGRCRVELIGPETHVFKAVLVANLAGDVTAAAAWFLAAFAPDWRDAPAWLTAQLSDAVRGGEAETHLLRLHVWLRRLGHQPAVILTLSWVPDAGAGRSRAVARGRSIPTPADDIRGAQGGSRLWSDR